MRLRAGNRPLNTPPQAGQSAVAISDSGSNRVSGRSLHSLVIDQAMRTPDAVAVSVGPVSISYGELALRSHGLATELLRAGAVGDEFIGVCVDRSLEAIIGLLGVLMAGAAYVPLGVDLPCERARMAISDARIRIITGVPIPATWGMIDTCVPIGTAGQSYRTDEAMAILAGVELPKVHPASAAYAIFTSGSTGRPKGVVASHQAVVSSTLARFEVFPHDPMTYLMLAPLTFDAAVAGLYFTLAVGGRLVVPTAEEVLDPGLLAALANRESVSHIDGVPSQYAALLTYSPEALRGVRFVVLAGEPLPVKLVRDHFAVAPDTDLFNEYGPTEGTVWSTVHRCGKNDEGPVISIGRAIDGVRVSLYGENLTPVHPGAVGEICIGGMGLARCYLGKPAMTAERFVPDPDPRHAGGRIYRTGDLGRMDKNGDLVYCGRNDHLVKVRGFRVELGEVEARLREHPDLSAAVVVPHASSTGVRLVAIVTPAPGRVLTAKILTRFVEERLPGYMTPTVWRQTLAIPLNSHGKVDRALLEAQWMKIGNGLTRQVQSGR